MSSRSTTVAGSAPSGSDFAWLPELGSTLADKYELDAVLQEGGMGVVVSARHLVLGQQVAIKFLRPRKDKQRSFADRFLREARTAARLRSEHVARVLDVGTTEQGIPYIVMERLVGCDLAELLDEREELPHEEAVDFILQAAEAVAEAHSIGIVHRDLKPSNLFVCERADGTPMLKVIDFGIAKALEPERFDGETLARFTHTGEMLGSPGYMSPEQLRDSSAVDHRSDVWSLGCTLYELITGQPPFLAETLPSLVAKVTADPYVPMAALLSGVPEQLDEVVARCLEKKPARRFDDVAAFALALRPWATSHGERLIESIHRMLDQSMPTPAEPAEAPPRAAAAVTQSTLEIPLRRTGARGWLAAALLSLGAVFAVTMWPDRPAPTNSRAPATTGPSPLDAPEPTAPADQPATASAMRAPSSPPSSSAPASSMSAGRADAGATPRGRRRHRASPQPTVIPSVASASSPSAAASAEPPQASDPLADRK